MDTQQLVVELGEAAWLADPQVLAWLAEYVRDGLEKVRNAP